MRALHRSSVISGKKCRARAGATDSLYSCLPRPEARLVSLGTGRAGRLGTQSAEAAAARGVLSISVVARVEDGQDDRLLQWARNSAGSTRIERAPQAFAVWVMLRPGASDSAAAHEEPRQQIELVHV